MKTVLVPTDFSKYANAGVCIASTFAQKAGSPIVLHHNIPGLIRWDALSELDRANYPEVLAKTVEADMKLKELVNSGLLRDLTVDKIITHGATAEEIAFKSKQLHADMIIMGSHGKEVSERYFIGSNVQRVIRAAMCPVLAAKREFHKNSVERIVFASQFEREVHKPFAEVLKVAKALQSKIHLLYVNTPAQFTDTRTAQTRMDEFRSTYRDQQFETAIYNQRDPVAGILEYSDGIHADMIALVTRDRKKAAGYLLGITESVVFHSDIPVLSINARIFEPVLN